MKPVMYLFLNRSLSMSVGKACAQVGHAAVEAYSISDQAMIDHWRVGGHYTKIVMLAEDTEQLVSIKHYIEERGYQTKLIVDEGRTEIPSFSPTALGVVVVDRDDPHTAATFESFRTYKEEKPPKKKGIKTRLMR